MERQTVTKVPRTATRNHSVQRSAAPSSSGHRVTELQRSIGSQAVQRLINSPLIQAKLNQSPQISQHSPIRVARVPCTSAVICSPPTGVPGSARSFGSSQEREEAAHRARRRRMTSGRSTSTSHAGRARQLEIFLNAEQPGRLANIQGVFIDHDLASRTGALTMDCAAWIADSLPAGAPTPPAMAGATKDCTFVPGQLNQEALEFNTTTNAMIGGIPRSVWRAETLQLLVHETEHPRFEGATAARPPQPAGVTSPTCTRSAVNSELSEIAATLSEFPPISRAVATEANPLGPLHASMRRWLPAAFHTGGENIKGALRQMGCHCNCTEVDTFVIDTFNEVSTAGAWSAAEKADFNAKARAQLPSPGPPRWPL
jgi:hypothetical protein